jgi:hypothetical protein
MECESQWETTREPFVVGNEVLHWNLVTTNVGTSLSMDYKYGLHPPHLHDGLGQVWATNPRHLT